MLFAAQQRLENLAAMVHRLVEVHDLDGVQEAESAHVLQPFGPVVQEHHLAGGVRPPAWAAAGTSRPDGTPLR